MDEPMAPFMGRFQSHLSNFAVFVASPREQVVNHLLKRAFLVKVYVLKKNPLKKNPLKRKNVTFLASLHLPHS